MVVCDICWLAKIATRRRYIGRVLCGRLLKWGGRNYSAGVKAKKKRKKKKKKEGRLVELF